MATVPISWMVRLTARVSSGGPDAARAAMATAVVSSSSSGTHFHTSPTRSASAPSMAWPKTTAAMAACRPATLRNIQVWPPPGWMPRSRKRVSNLADAPASRTSHASARFMPAPTAAPLTAARVGSGLRATRRNPS